MIKYSVKKPFTVLVAVIIVLVIGVVSLTGMETNLLPEMDMPYMMVITTYPGASPEKVEENVTKPMESTLGTINGVKSVTSTSAENYSMVMLEFEEDTNMDSAMVKVSSGINQIEGQLPDICGTPNVMELSMDMMATMYASVSYEGKDIYDLSSFTKDTVIPYFERQEGVASVSDVGLVEKTIEVRLNKEKIDDINEQIMLLTNDKLADAKSKITDSQNTINESKTELEEKENDLATKKEDTSTQLADATLQLNQAVATKAAYESQLVSLQASKTALEGEMQIYTDKGIENSYNSMNGMFSQMQSAVSTIQQQIGSMAATPQIPDTSQISDTPQEETDNVNNLAENEANEVSETSSESNVVANTQIPEQYAQVMALDTAKMPVDIKDAIDHPEKLEYFKTALQTLQSVPGSNIDAGVAATAAALNAESLKQVYDIVNTRIPQIKTELANLDIEIMAAQKVVEQITSKMGTIDDSYKEAESGKISAAAGFGSGEAQLAAAKTALDDAQTKLDEAMENYEDSVDAALKNANLDQLLTLDSLSGIITAQNFSMPAGYIDDENDNQWLLKVGENYTSLEDLKNMVLCNIDDIGDVKLGDVSDLTIIDNSGDAYAKVNGNQGVLLSIFKGSTSGTSDVSKACNEAISDLEEKYPGLDITPLVDQGDYIKMIIESIVSSMVLGALLAITILAIFLRDIRPTLVVAFSIPFSVLFAIVIMYFTHISINMMSLAGLSLAVGMLVDNSIVVIENIYRLRHRGLESARAAVQGGKQVAGAIIASTLTTVCVFLPMVFTTGLVRQLMLPFALTISFTLIASLIVALTVVPTMGSVLLSKKVPKTQGIFTKLQDGYEKVLRFCLRFKIVPLGIAVGLLAFCIVSVMRMGITLIPDMGSDQISITVTMPEDYNKEESYQSADAVMDKVLKVDGVAFVGAMDGNSSSGLVGGGAMGGNSADQYQTFTFYALPDEDITKTKEVNAICDAIKEQTKDMDCEITVSNSMMGEMDEMLGSGLEIDIYGNDLTTLTEISEDLEDMLAGVDGFENISNGQEDADEAIHLLIDKDEAMRLGITVAQIYSDISDRLTTDKSSVTLEVDDYDMDVKIVDETDNLTKENLLDMEFETEGKDDEGNTVTETHKLSDVARLDYGSGIASINRSNSERKMSVTADTKSGYNTTLLSRKVENLLEDYEVPEGYSIEFGGETSNVTDMITQMAKLMLLAFVLIYLVMVAQFQSLLSPFIVIFTVPLAFTGGLLGLMISGKQISLMSLIGFLVLMGTVVNNGIVFVDYTNQLRIGGMTKREALVATGKTRMRPILMTALTTILAMLAMIFNQSTGGEMGQDMAIVVTGGLIYATFMTLFIIPVMYDILYRKQPKVVDVGDDSIDDVPDDAAEFIAELEKKELN
ncbi:efflux RND transporter permease subunit [Roseburia hominis]|uniref:efflux RND transporter permease subunit n=1 Tax=Roseburia hominis TaxID=301301 RepID=UPI001F3DA7EA|nr:efflux RND transporter permease subunit [Roseburia hominis]